MNLTAKTQRAIATLKRVAKWHVPEEGWTLIVTSWEDNTFHFEYRHSNDQGIHRFFYRPESNQIHHILCTIEQIAETPEGQLEERSNCILNEYLNIEDCPDKKISNQIKDNPDIRTNPYLKCKIKGDAGVYEVGGIDWLNETVLCYRASEYEKIPFRKISWI
jgi:hypothetical protein